MKDEHRPFDGVPLADLTGLERDVLVAVGRMDEPGTHEIGRELERHYSGVRFALDKFEERDLVRKWGNEDDQRKNCFELTDAGIELVRRRRDWISDAVDE